MLPATDLQRLDAGTCQPSAAPASYLGPPGAAGSSWPWRSWSPRRRWACGARRATARAALGAAIAARAGAGGSTSGCAPTASTSTSRCSSFLAPAGAMWPPCRGCRSAPGARRAVARVVMAAVLAVLALLLARRCGGARRDALHVGPQTLASCATWRRRSCRRRQRPRCDVPPTGGSCGRRTACRHPARAHRPVLCTTFPHVPPGAEGRLPAGRRALKLPALARRGSGPRSGSNASFRLYRMKPGAARPRRLVAPKMDDASGRGDWSSPRGRSASACGPSRAARGRSPSLESTRQIARWSAGGIRRQV